MMLQIIARLAFILTFSFLFRGGSAMSTRQATLRDLEAVVDVVLAAMPLDPQWNYRFQYRHQYPKEHRKFTKLLFQLFIDPAYDDWHVMVAEAPSIDDPQLFRIVAFAVWDISYINKAKHGSGCYRPQNPMEDVTNAGGAARRDANPARAKAFRKCGIEGKQRYFNNIYGDAQIHLQILGTHPDYMRHGHGTNLCKWGMSKAEKDNVVVSLLASPMGRYLYDHLGFKFLGTLLVQVPGEEEKVDMHAMVLDEREERLRHELL